MSMLLMVKAMNIKVGNPLRKLVLIKLADNASDNGECWPSYQHIADQCEISKRSVMNHISFLCKAGFIKKEYRPGPKGNSTNIYHLTLGEGQKNDALDGAGDSLPPSAGDSLGSAGDSLPPSAGDSLGSAGDSLPPSAGDSPRTSHSLEPVIEPKDTPIVPTGDACEEPSPIDDKPEKNTQAILTVFRHWKAEHNHSTAKLDQKRRKRINARLEEGFSPDELCKAISGAKYDAWLMGKNPSNRKYDGIETLLRDAAQVEKLRDLTNNEHAKAVATGEYSAVTASNLENIQRWLEREDEGAPI